MEWKILFLLVEGPDDERFANNVLKGAFLESYSDVRIIRYAQKTKKQVNAIFSSVVAMGADYFLLVDMDGAPCISHRKAKTLEKFNGCDGNKIQVVVQEIEGWYVAGLNSERQEFLKIRKFISPNLITKEQFNDLVPKSFQRRDFLIELLKEYSWDLAISQNDSLRYFAEKIQIS